MVETKEKNSVTNKKEYIISLTTAKMHVKILEQNAKDSDY